jgi:uncharacterized protein YuzE
MKIDYDEIADALYIKYTNNWISYTKDSDAWIIDYDNNGNVVWIEMIWVKELFNRNNVKISSQKRNLEMVC